MINLKQYENLVFNRQPALIWPETIEKVPSIRVNRAGFCFAPYAGEGVSKPVRTTPDAIASYAWKPIQPRTASLITWMHTFSTAKMWIAVWACSKNPYPSSHSSTNRRFPWAEIDMDS